MYASDSVALAVLETLVHASGSVAPAHRVIAVDIPDSLTVTTVEVSMLPAGWRHTPAPAALRVIGRDWIEAAETAVLRVPSAIVPSESNFLLNPLHADFPRLAVHPPEPFEVDMRLFR